MKSPIIDFVMCGQSEKTFPGFIEAIRQHKPLDEVHNLSYEIDGELHHKVEK